MALMCQAYKCFVNVYLHCLLTQIKVTALDVARTLGHSEVCEELMKHFEPRESKVSV